MGSAMMSDAYSHHWYEIEYFDLADFFNDYRPNPLLCL